MKKKLHNVAIICGVLSTGAAFAQPQFGAVQTNPFGLTDVGDWTAPRFVDLDDDGDLDVMVGEQGGDWYYFQNTGTATAPAFAASAMNSFGLTNISDVASCGFGDMDNDGDQDMMGLAMGGSFRYFENTGTAAAPAFAAVATNPFGLTSSGPGVYNVAIGDIDGDGTLDIQTGTISGDFKLYRNTGSVTAPAFGPIATNFFGLANNGSLASPEFGDLDMDGDLDLISGENSGTGDFKYYENTGSSTAPAYAAVVTNPYSLTAIGGNVMEPTFGDLDGDTDLDLLVGNTTGNLYYFENTQINAGIAESGKTSVSIYPNPTNGMFTVGLGGGNGSYTISNIAGKMVKTGDIAGATSVDLTAALPGVYFVTIENAGMFSVHKVIVH